MSLSIIRNEALLHDEANDLTPYIQTYLLFKQVRDNTSETYTHILEDFLRNCLQPTQSAFVHLYIEEMKKKYSPLTVNRRLVIIKNFCQYLNDHDIVPNKVHLQCQYNYEYRGGTKDCIPDDKFLEMLDLCDVTSVIGLRDLAFLRLLQSSAMRVSEPLNCRIKDIQVVSHPSGEKVHLLKYTQKGGYEAFVRLFPKTLEAINAYIAFRGERRLNDLIFQSHKEQGIGNPWHEKNAQAMVRQKLNAVGLVGGRYTPHSFRYTQAIKALEVTGDEHKASQQLRHVSPKTIQYYTQDFRGRLLGLNQLNLEI